MEYVKLQLGKHTVYYCSDSLVLLEPGAFDIGGLRSEKGFWFDPLAGRTGPMLYRVRERGGLSVEANPEFGHCSCSAAAEQPPPLEVLQEFNLGQVVAEFLRSPKGGAWGWRVTPRGDYWSLRVRGRWLQAQPGGAEAKAGLFSFSITVGGPWAAGAQGGTIL